MQVPFTEIEQVVTCMVSTYLTRAMKGVRVQVTGDFTHLPTDLVVHGALQRGGFALLLLMKT